MGFACGRLAAIANRLSKPRGRTPGVEVDPELVRLARLEAGLSMAQLAGSEVTRQAIFLIEAGRTRPSAHTLEMIASRTRKPVSFFLRDRGDTARSGQVFSDPRVAELQALCLQQQFAKAVELGLKMLNGQLTPSVEAHIRQYVGQALVKSSHPDEALQHLRRAHVLLESQPDPWLEVECADWEACALYLKEDSRALAVAENALKLCRVTKPRLPGTEARILEHIATIHVRNHSYQQGVRFYQEALRTAGTLKDLPRLGRTYHGLSIAYRERGEIGRAVEFTHKALALYALEHDTALLARGENELGLLLMRQGQLERAEEAFRAALEHMDESGTKIARSHVLLSLGELHTKRGRLEDGLRTVKEAIDLADRLGETLASANGHLQLGQIYERMHRRHLADREVRAAMHLLEEHGAHDRLAESHSKYAEILEARGDARGAARWWKRAARLALQHRPLASSGAL